MTQANLGAATRGTADTLTLPLCTLMHFAVDGVCAATLAVYALAEPRLEPIILYFGLYTGVAFGGQWLAGWLLDRHPERLRPALAPAVVLLGLGTMSGLGIFTQCLLLGLGNCLFHAAAGALVLRRFRGFTEPGVFVASGAVGLALGLNGFCGALPFWVIAAACATALIVWPGQKTTETVVLSAAPAEAAASPDPWSKWAPAALVCSALLLLGCVVLRGAAGGGGAAPHVLLFPCVFALGKALGGVCCDRMGYKKTVLLIFLMGFLALQWQGLVPALILALAFNMTMPLTLRLLHRCRPSRPGLMFGLAAGCLLPGYFFPEAFAAPVQALVVLQFLALMLAGVLIFRLAPPCPR